MVCRNKQAAFILENVSFFASKSMKLGKSGVKLAAVIFFLHSSELLCYHHLHFFTSKLGVGVRGL